VGDIPSKDIDVLHGSAAIFDKPNMDNYLTGEGGGGYGYGFHSTLSPRTVSDYAFDDKSISIDGTSYFPNQKEHAIASSILNNGYDNTLKDAKKFALDNPDKPFPQEKLKIIEGLKDSSVVDTGKPGNVYKMSIPEQDIKTYLDYELPIREQSPEVISKLQEAQIKYHPNDSGGDVYRSLADEFNGEFGGDLEASEYLDSFGIKGMRYIDPIESSYRGNKDLEGAYNYTTFNPESLKVNSRSTLNEFKSGTQK